MIFGGGGLLQNSTSNRSLFYYLFVLLLFQFFKKETHLIAQGIGPIQGKIVTRFTIWILKRTTTLSVRDQGAVFGEG